MPLHFFRKRLVPCCAAVMAAGILPVIIYTFVVAVLAAGFSLCASCGVTEFKETHDVIVLDIDGDGDLDFAAGNSDATNVYKLDLHRNSGTGGFARTEFGRSGYFENFDAADVDGDGDLDIVMIDDVAGSVLEVYLNGGTGVFTTASYDVDILGLHDIVLTDVDTDGDADAVLVATAPVGQAVWLNSGTGAFAAAASTLPAATTLAAADITGDGAVDLVLAAGATAYVYRNSGTGAFTQAAALAGSAMVSAVAAGNLNSDGSIDVLVTDLTGTAIPFFNDGTGAGFTAGTPFGAVAQATHAALGDLDNDGDTDVLLGGKQLGGGPNGGNETWLNDGNGVFSQIGTPTEEGVHTTMIALGDLDADGDLDVVAARKDPDLIFGALNGLYLNDEAAVNPNAAPSAPGGGFSAGVAAETELTGPGGPSSGTNGTATGSVAWSDAGYLDVEDGIVATASIDAADPRTHFLLATGFGFTIPSDAVIAGITVQWTRRAGNTGAASARDGAVRIVKAGSVGAADRSGNASWPATLQTATYGSGTDLWGQTWTPSDINSAGFGAALSARYTAAINQADLEVDAVRVTVAYRRSATLTLEWGAGSDSETNASLLQYQVRVGTVSGGHDVVSGRAASPDYVSRVAPSSQHRRLVLRHLPCGQQYFWAVRTRDSSLALSGEGAEQQATVTADCTGTTTSASAVAGGGGGRGWWLPYPAGGAGTAFVPGEIGGEVFLDLNSNGTRDRGERSALPGTAVRVEGGGTSFDTVINPDGTFRLSVPPGTYDVRPKPDASLVRASTTPASVTVTVASGGSATANFGFRDPRLAAYRPCLRIRRGDGATGTAATELLERLMTAGGVPATAGVQKTGQLISRSAFISLLVRTQCLDLVTSADEVRSRLRLAARLPEATVMGLADLPLHDDPSLQAREMYSAMLHGVPVARHTKLGPMADADAPVLRSEAVRMVAAVTSLAADEGRLPTGVEEGSDLARDVRGLAAVGALPLGFRSTLQAGVTWEEAAELLTLAAFAAGKMPLEDTTPAEKEPARTPASSGQAPTDSATSCLVIDPVRADHLHFRDIVPGSDLHDRVRLLSAIGAAAPGGRTRWLLSPGGDPEFGVSAGAGLLRPEWDLTVLDVLRAVAVFTCHPVETAGEWHQRLSGQRTLGAGTAEQLDAADRIGATPDDGSWPARLLRGVQRPIRTFNLTPLRYAPGLFLGEYVATGDAATVETTAKLLAAALLYQDVLGGRLTPQEAERQVQDRAMTVARALLDNPRLDWRNAAAATAVPATREMLVGFLADALGPAVRRSQERVTVGEAWWATISGPR